MLAGGLRGASSRVGFLSEHVPFLNYASTGKTQ